MQRATASLSELILVRLTGPLNDPRAISSRVAHISGDHVCTVCQCDLMDDDNERTKLDVCGHVLHLQCLDDLVNQAYLGKASVCCPVCRAGICMTRDYTAVVEESQDQPKTEERVRSRRHDRVSSFFLFLALVFLLAFALYLSFTFFTGAAMTVESANFLSLCFYLTFICLAGAAMTVVSAKSPVWCEWLVYWISEYLHILRWRRASTAGATL
jgi:hypothetical protein